MCGRFDFHGDPVDVREFLGPIAAAVTLPPPNYNVAVTELAPVLVRNEVDVAVTTMRFGVVHQGRGRPLVNARAETVHSRGAFRSAYQSRRVAVLVSGFYEWKAGPPPKQPYYVRRRDKRLMALAALAFPGEPQSFVILTTEPNELIAAVHDRMPVILDGDEARTWLLAPPEDEHLRSSLSRPYPDNLLEAYPVTKEVNRSGNSSPHYIEPLR